MTDVFSFSHYRAVLEAFLGSNGRKNRRGVSKLAEHLKVHPTFLSKVLLGKAHLSLEQSIGFCRFAGLSEDETEYFIDLVQHDRAATVDAQEHFSRRLRRQREKRIDLRRRLGASRDLDAAGQWEYYESWLPQAIHVMCQGAGKNTRESLAGRLRVSRRAVDLVVGKLLDLQLVRAEGDALVSSESFIHIAKDSPLTRRLHLNWRQKIAADLLTNTGDGLHFSGVAVMDSAAEAKIKRTLVEVLQSVKAEIAQSPSETPYVLALDFYEL